MAGICKNSQAIKNKSTCRAVKCNAYMLIGDGFPEESITSEQIELDNGGGRSGRQIHDHRHQKLLPQHTNGEARVHATEIIRHAKQYH